MAIVNFANRSTSGVDEDALIVTTAGESVFNFGRLTTTGDLAERHLRGRRRCDDPQFRSGRDQRSWRRRHLRARQRCAHRELRLGGDARQHLRSHTGGGGRRVLLRRHHRHRRSLPHRQLRQRPCRGRNLRPVWSGVGADGLVVNYGRVDSTAVGSSRHRGIWRPVAGDQCGSDDGQRRRCLRAVRPRRRRRRPQSRANCSDRRQAASASKACSRNTHLTNRGVVHIDADRELWNRRLRRRPSAHQFRTDRDAWRPLGRHGWARHRPGGRAGRRHRDRQRRPHRHRRQPLRRRRPWPDQRSASVPPSTAPSSIAA